VYTVWINAAQRQTETYADRRISYVGGRLGSWVANGQGAAGRQYTVAAIYMYCPTLPPPPMQSWKSNNDSHRAACCWATQSLSHVPPTPLMRRLVYG